MSSVSITLLTVAASACALVVFAVAAPMGRDGRQFTSRQYVVHTSDTAPQASKPILDAVLKGFGFVPNILAVFAESPALIKSYTSMDDALNASTMSAVEKNVVAIAAAAELGSGYCVPGHCTVGKGLGMSDESLAALRSDATLSDKKLEALRVFTRDVIRARGDISSEQLQAFLDAGYTRANSLDVLAIIGQKTISTYAFNLTKLPLDDAFKPQAQPAK